MTTSTANTHATSEFHRCVTDRIITALEAGTVPWRRPRRNDPESGPPMNVASGDRYNGINILLLNLAAFDRGYTSRWWGTFNQWKDLGAHVIKRPDHVPPGHWGTKILLFKPVRKAVLDEGGDEVVTGYRLLKQYTVFNREQVEGADLDRPGYRSTGPITPFDGHREADEVIAATGADIRYGGDRAFYRPSEDYIQLPHKRQFVMPDEFYFTAFHEWRLQCRTTVRPGTRIGPHGSNSACCWELAEEAEIEPPRLSYRVNPIRRLSYCSIPASRFTPASSGRMGAAWVRAG